MLLNVQRPCAVPPPPALATHTTPATRCLPRQLTSACLRSSASTLHIHPSVSPTVSSSCRLHRRSCSPTTTPITRDALLPRCVRRHACTHAPPVHRHHSMTPSSIPQSAPAPCMPPPRTPQGHPYVHWVPYAHPNPRPSFSRPPQPRPGTTSPATAPQPHASHRSPPPCHRHIRRHRMPPLPRPRVRPHPAPHTRC